MFNKPRALSETNGEGRGQEFCGTKLSAPLHTAVSSPAIHDHEQTDQSFSGRSRASRAVRSVHAASGGRLFTTATSIKCWRCAFLQACDSISATSTWRLSKAGRSPRGVTASVVRRELVQAVREAWRKQGHAVLQGGEAVLTRLAPGSAVDGRQGSGRVRDHSQDRPRRDSRRFTRSARIASPRRCNCHF